MYEPKHKQYGQKAAWAALLSLLLTMAACGGKAPTTHTDEARRQTDSTLMACGSTDVLLMLAQRYGQEGNTYGETAAYRELGKRYREESRFTEAISAHKRGLQCAIKACDTLQIIQALNNIGTNFRRMGILDEASSYHYQALSYCDAYSDKSCKTIRKDRVISLNGIGNVYLSLDNREAADSVLRQALAGERALGSTLGQAINCANIGSIFEANGQTDSARHYYQLSMQLNREARSDLGISLCHTYLGHLYESSHQLDSALAQYWQGYRIMQHSSDTWHRLEPCLALARIYIQKGNLAAASGYLESARRTATSISSLEHLAEVYRLEYLWYNQRGDCRSALESYVKSRAYADSVSSDKNMSHLQNMRISYERENKQNEINLIQKNYDNERTIRLITSAALVIVLILAIVVIAFLWYIIRMRRRKLQMMKQTDQMRTNFFTNITHEFRTPLTVIQSAAQDMMRLSPSDSDIRHNAADIIRHGQALLNLINQILDIAKMTASGRQEAHWVHGNIAEYVATLCESYRSYAASRGISMAYCAPAEGVEADYSPDYILKIVQNLISNAVKFSKPGGRVTVSTKTKGQTIQISVADDGIGMTEEQKEHIFKPFYQAANDSGNIGTGIGLSLVKLAVENMDGKIEVHTAINKGSVFVITLPIKNGLGGAVPNNTGSGTEIYPICTPTEESAAMPDDDSTDSDAIRILIVEDTPEVAHYMSRQLCTAYSSHFASSGEEALSKAEQLVPDLIITDIMMPGMDGLELCRRVRSSELLNHIPVIMVTAKATHEDRLQGLEAGADAYLEKPFHADELNIRVEKLLEQRRMLQQKYAQAAEEGGEADATLVSDANKAFLDKVTAAVQEMMASGKTKYDTLAYQLCLSRAQLNRKIKAITGYTTTEYILQIRISLAKQLLDRTDLSMLEVALRCGMDNNSYFCTLFKKSTGMTPLQYKNRQA